MLLLQAAPSGVSITKELPISKSDLMLAWQLTNVLVMWALSRW